VHHTDRIGEAALNTDQNIAGALARIGLGEHERFVLWVLGCLAVLALTVWAMRRVLRAGEPTLALICVALFGLVVSPVSWSHHWVWRCRRAGDGDRGWRRRNVALAVVSAAGIALMYRTPIDLLPKHHEAARRGGVNCSDVVCVWRWRSSSPPDLPSPPGQLHPMKRGALRLIAAVN